MINFTPIKSDNFNFHPLATQATKSMVNNLVNGTDPRLQGIKNGLFSNIGQGIKQTASSLVEPLKGGVENVKQIAGNVKQDVKSSVQDSAKDLDVLKQPDASGLKSAGAGFRVGGNMAKSVMSPITETINQFVGKTGNELSNTSLDVFGHEKKFANLANSKVGDVLAKANIPMDKYAQWANQHPEAAKNLEALGNITALGTSIPATEELGGLTKSALDTGAESAKLGLNAVKSDISKGASKVMDVAQKVDSRLGGEASQNVIGKNTNQAIEAVNPDLSGKKLVQGYKDIVTGKREMSSSGLLKGQELGMNKQTVDLGTRLSDLKFSKDPVKNLQTLGDAMKQTETKLTPLLENDKTPVMKQGLTDSFDELKSQMPREFKSIKDSTNAFEDVISFAKETANNAEPTIKGQRIARTKFDTQAKLEYPNAFRDGAVDIKTPAGRAIKAVRDSWNNYLYNTAENGSEIQNLIGREADIFRATDNIAPKAAKLQGLSKLNKFTQKHSTGIKVGEGLVGGLALEEIGRRLIK